MCMDPWAAQKQKGEKKLYASVAMLLPSSGFIFSCHLPRLLRQSRLSPNVKGGNEMIPGPVPGI